MSALKSYEGIPRDSARAYMSLPAHNLRGKPFLKVRCHHWYLHHVIVCVQIVLSVSLQYFYVDPCQEKKMRMRSQELIPGIEKLIVSKPTPEIMIFRDGLKI